MADLDEALAIYDDALAEAHRRGSSSPSPLRRPFARRPLSCEATWPRPRLRGARLSLPPRRGTTARASVYLAANRAEALLEQGKLDEAAAALDRSGLDESLPNDARLLFLPNIRARLRMLRGDLAGGLGPARCWPPIRRARGRNPAFMAWRASRPRPAPARRAGRGPRLRWRKSSSFARTWGAPWRSARPCERRTGPKGARVARASRGGGRVLTNSPAKPEPRRRAPSWGGTSGVPVAAPRRASSCDARVELATICGATPSSRAPRPNFAPLGRGPARCPEWCQIAHAERAARRPDGGQPYEPRDRASALRHPEDGRGPPLERLPQARIRSRSQLPEALAQPSRG